MYWYLWIDLLLTCQIWQDSKVIIMAQWRILKVFNELHNEAFAKYAKTGGKNKLESDDSIPHVTFETQTSYMFVFKVTWFQQNSKTVLRVMVFRFTLLTTHQSLCLLLNLIGRENWDTSTNTSWAGGPLKMVMHNPTCTGLRWPCVMSFLLSNLWHLLWLKEEARPCGQRSG